MTDQVYRVDWLPGTDLLHGTCHCGAVYQADDPIVLWTWLLAHPGGHHVPPAPPTEERPRAGIPVAVGATY